MNHYVRFEIDKYIHSNRMIIPCILLLSYLAVMYSVAPQNILDSFSISALVLFLIMLAAGVVYDDIVYEMAEQALLVKVKSKYKYYLGRVLLMLVFSFVFALVAVVYPVAVHFVNHSRFFTRNFVISDILSAITVFSLAGFCGGVAGLFFNRRIIEKRSISIILAVLAGITVLIKGALMEDFSIFRFFAWLLPPLYDLSVKYSEQEYFSIENSGAVLVWMTVYSVFAAVLYVRLMVKRGVE